MSVQQINEPAIAGVESQFSKYPRLHATPAISPADQDHILRFVHRHGRGSVAYSTLQDGLGYFVDQELGYFAYMPLVHPVLAPGGINVVIGDPVAAREDYERLLDVYLEKNDAAATAFLEISKEFADILHARGFPVNELGVEWELDLPDFDLRLPGQNFSHLRRWRNKAEKEGVEIVEGRISDLLKTRESELMALNAEWLKRKGGHEFVGLTRPLCVEDHPFTRYFWATWQGRLVSLAIFDPMFENGQVFGYLHNLSRVVKDAPHGTNDLIILEAMKKFKAEGVQVLSLGLSPLAELSDQHYKSSRTVSGLFRFMYNHCQFVYPFKGNYFHKDKYRGRSFKVYISAVPALNLYRILGVFKAAHII